MVPVVTASITSFNDGESVTGRIRSISANGFEYKLQEQEENESGHATETVSYIAWEPSLGKLDGVAFEVSRTGNAVSHLFRSIYFNGGYARTPLLIADMQTANEEDAANLRWRNKSATSVAVKVDEEQSHDWETMHVVERVGYLVLSAPDEESNVVSITSVSGSGDGDDGGGGGSDGYGIVTSTGTTGSETSVETGEINSAVESDEDDLTDSPEVEPEEVDSYDDSLDQIDSSDSAASMSDDLMAERYPSLDTPPVESMPVDFEPVDYSSDDAEAEVSPSVMVAGKAGASAQRKRLKKDCSGYRPAGCLFHEQHRQLIVPLQPVFLPDRVCSEQTG